MSKLTLNALAQFAPFKQNLTEDLEEVRNNQALKDEVGREWGTPSV